MTHKDFQVSFKTDDNTWQTAKAVFAQNHLDDTQALNLFLMHVAMHQELPFPIHSAIQHERLVQELIARVRHNAAEIEQGNFITLEEAKRRLLSND